ncbi:hypothetical protein Tco_0285326 [Tanacetum coccineum]
MPTKIELTLEQSQQGVSDDILVSIEWVEELKEIVILFSIHSDEWKSFQSQPQIALRSSKICIIKKSSNGDVIVVEDDHDVMHDNNSLDLTLSDSLNDLDFAALNIDSQSMKIKAPPDIIPVDDDDDFIHDADNVPHDLAYFNDEVIANADDDDDDEDAIVVYSSDEED